MHDPKTPLRCIYPGAWKSGDSESCVDGSVIYSGPKGKAAHESPGGWVDKQAGSVYRNLPLPTEGRQSQMKKLVGHTARGTKARRLPAPGLQSK